MGEGGNPHPSYGPDWGVSPPPRKYQGPETGGIPGKEPETREYHSVNRQTPVKILPSPFFGCGR